MINSKWAITNLFNCETVEDSCAYTKIRVTAEIVLDFGANVHHINTDEVKIRLQHAVKDAVWFDGTPRKPCNAKDGDNAK